MGMNANAIINDEMTLEEKLAAIDAAVADAQAQQANNQVVQDDGSTPALVEDPQNFLMCEGCQ